MQPFTTLTAIGVPLPWPDINTDDIYPASGAGGSAPKLSVSMMTDRDGMGRHAFAGYRYREDGTPDPEFVLNRAPYDQGEILVAGSNFGCGSSREMAVWALMGMGLRCVIAPSFADIFYANAIKNGLLPVKLPADEVAVLTRLVTDQPLGRLTVELTEQTVATGDAQRFSFPIGAYHRHMLLNGLDEIAATLQRASAIEEHEAAYHKEFPWLLETSR